MHLLHLNIGICNENMCENYNRATVHALDSVYKDAQAPVVNVSQD